MASEARAIWDGLTPFERSLLVSATTRKIVLRKRYERSFKMLRERGLTKAGRATDLGRSVVEAGKTAESEMTANADLPSAAMLDGVERENAIAHVRFRGHSPETPQIAETPDLLARVMALEAEVARLAALLGEGEGDGR